MMHVRSKRLTTWVSTALAALAAVVALSAPESAVASAEQDPPAAANTAGAVADRWSDTPHGFASLAGGSTGGAGGEVVTRTPGDLLQQTGARGSTTGGAGGKVVTVTDQASLAKYAAAEGRYIIRVKGSIAVWPFGSSINVTSDKTIIGVGTSGEIVHGELNLKPGTHNVIIRNLAIRDSYVEGDWDGKTQDFDAIQLDTVDHVWIDHNRLTHMGDGLIDLRKDSQYITVSYNRFENHNKAFGIGWTDNVKTQITIDHNWFNGTKQRNPSADNCAYAHLYNNYFQDVSSYGSSSRGRTKMLVENSYYEDVKNPYQADATAELVQRGSILKNTTGRHDEWGTAFDAHDFYDYQLDPAAAVPALVKAFSGPQKNIGTNTVLNVPADYPTVQSAVDAVPEGNDGQVTVRIAPGTYREKVRIPATKPHLTLQGTGDDRSQTEIVYNTPAADGGSSGSATVMISASDVTAENLTFTNDFAEPPVTVPGQQALAMKTTGDRIVFRNTAFKANQDTLMTNTPKLETVARVYIRDSYIEGDVDFIYGRATTVIERSVIKALNRGSSTNNGWVTAASTWKENPYGFLITNSRIISDAPVNSVHLGRPWHPGGNPDAIAQVLIRDTELPAAIKTSPWSDMSGFSWKDARFSEYHNYGPGSIVTPDRPQMSAADAARHTTSDYLSGTDGWAPHRS